MEGVRSGLLGERDLRKVAFRELSYFGNYLQLRKGRDQVLTNPGSGGIPSGNLFEHDG